MKQSKTANVFIRTLGLLVMGGVSSVTLAANPVDYVDLAPGDGININDGKIVVSPVNGEYAQVTSGNTVTFHQRFKAGCKGTKALLSTKVYAGAVTVSGGIMESTGGMYSSGVAHQHAKSIPFKEVVMDVPLNKLGIDPIQECKDLLQQKMNQGSSKMQVMNSDQTVIKPMTFSGVASCGKIGSGNDYYEKDYLNESVKITCKAGSSVGGLQGIKINKPNTPQGPSQIQAGYQPLVITQANLLAETLNYTGSCPKDLKFNVKIKGQGRGGVKWTVKDGIKFIANGQNNTFDEKGTWWEDDFTFVVKAENINQQINHNFSLKVEYRDGKAQGFNWIPFDGTGLQWKHKCTPQAKFQLGNQQGGGINYNDQNSPAPMKIQPMQAEPERPKRAQ